MKQLELIGKKFNRLTVLERSSNKGSKVMWKCRCDCGNITYVATSNLTGNKAKSCGCYKLEEFSKRFTKHNQRHTKLYEVWKSIKQRCFNTKCKAFHNYGGRGITMCNEWKNDFVSFYNWSMKNGYNDNLTLDRIDNNGNYEPSNCRWVERDIQANNTRVNHLLEYNGKTHTIAEWSKIFGLSYTTVFYRLKKGWSIEKTLTTPVKKR